MKKVEIMRETQRVHAVQLTGLAELRSLRKQFDEQTADFKMICKLARDEIKEVKALIEERFAIQAQSLEHVYSRTANVLQHMEQQIEILIREQNVLRNAIKELKNVNDGR